MQCTRYDSDLIFLKHINHAKLSFRIQVAFLKRMADSRLVPPTRQEVEDSCSQLGIPSYRSIPPFYSRETDRLADRQQKDMKLQQTVHSDEQLAAFEGARSALEQLQTAAMARTFGVVPRLGQCCGSAAFWFRLIHWIRNNHFVSGTGSGSIVTLTQFFC
jgi:hypothetical protein